MQITITLKTGKQIALEEAEYKELQEHFAFSQVSLPTPYPNQWIQIPYPYPPIMVTN